VQSVDERANGPLFHAGIASDDSFRGGSRSAVHDGADSGEEPSSGSGVAKVERFSIGRNSQATLTSSDYDSISSIFPGELGALGC